MNQLLITGFYGTQTEPRPDHMNNPSGKIVKQLDGSTIAGYNVEGIVIDSPIRERAKQIRQLMETKQPLAYLALGVAARSNKFSFLKSIVNEIDTTDHPHHNDGQLHNLPIIPHAPNVLINDTIDFDALTRRFNDEGLLNEEEREVVGAGAITVAFAQLYYGLSRMPRLSMLIPPDHEFSMWNEDKEGGRSGGVMDIDISKHAAVLALEVLVESRSLH